MDPNNINKLAELRVLEALAVLQARYGPRIEALSDKALEIIYSLPDNMKPTAATIGNVFDLANQMQKLEEEE